MFKKVLTLICAISALISSAAVTVQLIELKPGDEAAKKAYFALPRNCRLWGTKGYKPSDKQYNAILVMRNDKVNFAFHLRGNMVDGTPRGVQIGMISPTHFNWYAGGFVDIKSGKKLLNSGKFSVKETKSGDAGIAILDYSEGAFNGTITLALADNDDKVGFVFTPADKTLRFSVQLTAYPGEYGNAKLRKRVVYTNTGKGENPKKLTPQDFYCVFGDEYYDIAQKRGRGCCAFLFNPKEIIPGSTIRCGYACTAYLYFNKGSNASFVFWDFAGKSLAEALEYMKNIQLQ